MTGLNHAATGAFVAVAINKPVIALPAALLSHFAVDVLPHWSYKLKPGYQQLAEMMDLTWTLSILLVLSLIFSHSARLIIAGGLLGVLPDALSLPNILEGKPPPMNGSSLLHKIRRFHHRIQHEYDNGYIFEIGWFIVVIFLFFK
jgi:hypothetical protein